MSLNLGDFDTRSAKQSVVQFLFVSSDYMEVKTKIKTRLTPQQDNTLADITTSSATSSSLSEQKHPEAPPPGQLL